MDKRCFNSVDVDSPEFKTASLASSVGFLLATPCFFDCGAGKSSTQRSVGKYYALANFDANLIHC